MPDLFMQSNAVLSDCGRYRYRLDRRWGNGPTMGFVMLNPSTADAEVDDPTIRRCIGFAKREGCGSLQVVNLFAFRATDPEELYAADDPVGPGNDNHVRYVLNRARIAVAAWGAHRLARDPGDALAKGWRRMVCLGKTKAGAPRHPLYVRKDAPLIPILEARNA